METSLILLWLQDLKQVDYLNYIQFQVVSLFLLFLGVLMTIVPMHVINLIEYCSTNPNLAISLSTQEFIRSLLSRTLFKDVGLVLLGISVCLLLPSSLGYFGAVRESRLILFLVRIQTWSVRFNKSLFLVLHSNPTALGPRAFISHPSSSF